MKGIFKKENLWHLIGVGIGIVMIIVGIVFACAPAESYSTKSADYASFGADFYTYQYEATRYAVTNTAVTANNLREIGGRLAAYFGTGFIFAGALVILNYGKKLFEEIILAKPETCCCSDEGCCCDTEATAEENVE